MDWVKGSVLCPEDLRPRLDGYDAVVHLVGIVGEVRDQTFERVHYEATLRVVEAALACGVRRMVGDTSLMVKNCTLSNFWLLFSEENG
jgi:nucleoside-diphosphate-sugar epimerase